jgi:hypothetical protein
VPLKTTTIALAPSPASDRKPKVASAFHICSQLHPIITIKLQDTNVSSVIAIIQMSPHRQRQAVFRQRHGGRKLIAHGFPSDIIPELPPTTTTTATTTSIIHWFLEFVNPHESFIIAVANRNDLTIVRQHQGVFAVIIVPRAINIVAHL